MQTDPTIDCCHGAKRRLWFDVICPWVQGSGMSGGDRIWIEFVRAWKKAGHAVAVMTSEEGRAMMIRSGLDITKVPVWSLVDRPQSWISEALMFFTRTLRTCYKSATTMWLIDAGAQVVYSVSDFWPDTLPALIAKIRYPKITWVAGFYLFAPAPWRRPLREWIRGWTYWLTQKIAYRLIIRYSDIMCVTTEESKARVIRDGRAENNVVVVRGGVDTAHAEKWLAKGVSCLVDRPWDAVFVGRFHHTKGLKELVDAWKLVIGVLPEANLAIIGEGEMAGDLEKMIVSANLEKRIKVLGFLDGEEKYEVFKHSKIFVNPTMYNGGMAAIEGMAWGLPAVGFDLPSQRTYYPKGMFKVPPGDVPGFACAIFNLLTDGEMYAKLRHEGLELAKEWDWGARAQMVVDAVWRKVDQNGQT